MQLLAGSVDDAVARGLALSRLFTVPSRPPELACSLFAGVALEVAEDERRAVLIP